MMVMSGCALEKEIVPFQIPRTTLLKTNSVWDEWKFVWKEGMAPFVRTLGIMKMPQWSVDN